MNKPEGLRRLLLATALKGAGDKLSMFVDRGRLRARMTGSAAFEYAYSLEIVVQDYAGSIDDLMVPVLAWVAEQQPDLIERNGSDAMTFESELLDGDRADVSITLELTEVVMVERTGDRAWTATHLPEPPRGDAFPGVCGVALLRGIVADELAGNAEDIP